MNARTNPPHIRCSADGWRALARILGLFERCADSCARLDAHRDEGTKKARQKVDYRTFEHQLRWLGNRIEREIDRLTVERLDAELARKIRQSAA